MKRIISIALAVYGLAHIITKEHGPMAIFSRLRLWLRPNFGDTAPPDMPSGQPDDLIWQIYQQALLDYQAENELQEIEFYKTWQGYGYALVSCPICLGLYLAFIVSLFPVKVRKILAGYGLHLIILKRIN